MAPNPEGLPSEKVLRLVLDWEGSLEDKVEFLAPVPKERVLLVFTRRDRAFARNFDDPAAPFRELRPFPFRPVLAVGYHPEGGRPGESRLLFLAGDRLYEASLSLSTAAFNNLQERLDLKALGLDTPQLLTRDRDHFFVASRTAILKVEKATGRPVTRWEAYRIGGEVRPFQEIDLLKYDRSQHALLVGTERKILKVDDEVCEGGVAPFAGLLEIEDVYDEDPERRLKRRLVWAFEEAWEEVRRDGEEALYVNPLRHKFVRLHRRVQNRINSAHLISTVSRRSPSLGLLELERIFLVHNFRVQCLKIPAEDLERLDAARERELSSLRDSDPAHPTHHTVFNRDNLLAHLERRAFPLLKGFGRPPQVLEIACGSGKIAYGCAMALSRAGFPEFSVTGLDLNGGVLEVARRGRYPRESLLELPLRFHEYLEPDPSDPAAVRVAEKVSSRVRFVEGDLHRLGDEDRADLCLYVGSIPERDPRRRAEAAGSVAAASRAFFFTDALDPADNPAAYVPALTAFREIGGHGKLRGFVRKDLAEAGGGNL